jgi:GNAT superfamily N-acetyltransferase
MSWRILQRLFNIAPWKDVEYIEGKNGEKFWFYWRDYNEDIAKLRVLHRGLPAGHVNLVEGNKAILELADIYVVPPYRKLGIGKEMLSKIIQWAQENGYQKIWGFIATNQEVTLEYQKEWYKRQGFNVYEAKPGVFHISMKLQSDN